MKLTKSFKTVWSAIHEFLGENRHAITPMGLALYNLEQEIRDELKRIDGLPGLADRENEYRNLIKKILGDK